MRYMKKPAYYNAFDESGIPAKYDTYQDCIDAGYLPYEIVPEAWDKHGDKLTNEERYDGCEECNPKV